MKKLIALLMFTFIIGWFSNAGISIILGEPDEPLTVSNIDRVSLISQKANIERPTITTNMPLIEGQPSPKDRVRERQIEVYKDKIIINVQGASWTSYTDTNSMTPLLDKGANGLELVPQSSNDIITGDVVAYKPKNSEDLIAHRVKEINIDDEGLYYIVQGDNSPHPDPERVRFEQIQYVLIGVIY